MRLRITTPLTIALDQDDVTLVSAEDASGSFGIQPGHADFLTSLAIGVIGWVGHDGSRHECAVRGGVFTVSGGRDVAVATREAVVGDGTLSLEQSVLRRFRADVEADRADRADGTRLQLEAIRRIVRHLQPAGSGLLS